MFVCCASFVLVGGPNLSLHCWLAGWPLVSWARRPEVALPNKQLNQEKEKDNDDDGVQTIVYSTERKWTPTVGRIHSFGAPSARPAMVGPNAAREF